MTLDAEELRKIPGSVHFEQRLLFFLAQLRRPDTRVVYVTSEPIDPAILDYTLDLIPGLPDDHRERLVLLNCADASPEPLTGKVLARPALLSAIRGHISVQDNACLVMYNSTRLEGELAGRLGIPMYSCDPALAHLGTKSGGRRLLREAGVPVADGFEDLRSTADAISALTALKAAHPGLASAMVKLNESFAGVGNARFDYDGAPSANLNDWVASELPKRLRFHDPAETWENYRRALAAMGGIAECYLDYPEALSPSAQLEIAPGGAVRIVSTHDQILSGAIGQVFSGAMFPAVEPARVEIRGYAERAGRLLARRGVTGQLSIDFVSGTTGGAPYAIEINLRMGGTTAPFHLADAMVQGHTDVTGGYRSSDGRPCHYVASDRVQRLGLRGEHPGMLIEFARRSGLHYEHSEGTGCALYALGSVTELGRFGLIAIERSRDAARLLYDKLLSTLDGQLEGGPFEERWPPCD